MTNEPARILSAVTAAITATIGVLTIAGVWSADVGGALTAAAAAWILAAGELVRARVTPNGNVVLTASQSQQMRKLAFRMVDQGYFTESGGGAGIVGGPVDDE